MKVTTINNAEIVIQANVNKTGDWEAVQAVAAKMAAADDIDMDIASECQYEQWVHVCARWDHYQTKEINQLYKDCK